MKSKVGSKVKNCFRESKKVEKKYFTDIEKRSLQGTAASQEVTGAPVSFHPAAHEKSPDDLMRIFLEAGGKKEKTVICHLECKKHELMYELDT